MGGRASVGGASENPTMPPSRRRTPPGPGPDPAAVLARFSPATRAWFGAAFDAPTPAQVGAWDAVTGGAHALVVAPTGSGKTLAAFLWALDRLATEPVPAEAARRN